MNSRIVQPAPSFQPPDTCTEHEGCQAAQTPLEDLRRNALEHYEHVSTVAHQWHSAIPKAIAAYYADPERERLEREAIDYLLAWHTEKDPSKRSAAWHRLIAATSELAEFESQHLLKK